MRKVLTVEIIVDSSDQIMMLYFKNDDWVDVVIKEVPVIVVSISVDEVVSVKDEPQTKLGIYQAVDLVRVDIVIMI